MRMVKKKAANSRFFLLGIVFYLFVDNDRLMKTIYFLFGEGRDLTALQMSCRGISVFIIALILIRISGRRSFGMKTPLDNIIVILLGAILSRAVVGVSPFWPVVACSTVIVLFHRFLAWVKVKSPSFSELLEGNKIKLYENGKYLEDNMGKALACKEDVDQGVRRTALTEDMDDIKAVYMERNGEISAIKKKQ